VNGHIMHTQLTRINTTTWRSPTEPGYGTFLGAFGGWTCAAGVLAATELVNAASGDAFAPLALTINFIGPVRDGLIAIEPVITASTKSTTHVSLMAWSETATGVRASAPAASMSLVFAKRRKGDRIDVVAMPEATAADSVPRARFSNDKVSWPAQYDQRMVLGTPFQTNTGMRTLTWTRNADMGALSFARLAAMADASLPRIFFHYPAVSPISTVTMTVQFHCDAAELAAAGNDFVLIEATAQAARHGHFDQHVRIFSKGGQLLATSTQLVWFDIKNSSSSAPETPA
jgi:Thioesterase-like superfamily